MFILRTGLQGNGKTLNTIKEVDEKAAKEGRTVYFHNVTGLNPDSPVLKADWVEFEDPFKWFELPLNAIIVIDEAQKFFRVRPQGSAVPEYASALETMRKQGHELHCITQNPKLIDSHFRNLCNGHIHYSRGHQGKIIKRWRFETPCDVDKNKSSLDRHGECTRIKLDKRYFGVYQSVQDEAGHHFKFRPPRALFVFLACCVFLAWGGWYIYSTRIAPSPAAEPLAVPADVAPHTAQASGIVRDSPALDYVASRVPRVPDVPWSAPVYDELTKAATYPKPVCVATSDPALIQRAAAKFDVVVYRGRLHGCRCNTQQGTRIQVSFDACMGYVEHGAFDPAKPDPQPNQQVVAGATGAPEERGATVVPAATSYVTVVSDSEYPSRPWRSKTGYGSAEAP